MAEVTPLGVNIEGHPTDVGAAADIPTMREVLENSYNDFLDAKQQGQVQLEMRFDDWIAMSVRMLDGHRKNEIAEQFQMGLTGRAEYEALEEYRKKLSTLLKRADPTAWNFDQYGIQYVDKDNRDLYKQRVRPPELLTPNRRPVKIKTGPEGILRP